MDATGSSEGLRGVGGKDELGETGWGGTLETDRGRRGRRKERGGSV